MSERNGGTTVADKGAQHGARHNRLDYQRPSQEVMQQRRDDARCDMALDFLQQLRRKGPWVLTAILPDGDTRTFTCKTEGQAEETIRAYNGLRNIYYSVNPTRTAMSKKASKKDIAAAEFIHADLDPREEETSDEAKARYLKQLTDFKPQPTMIVDSGNGLNCLWRLDQSIPRDRFEELEQRNLQITLALGGPKGTQNVDRILRLPGTINIPNAKKRRQGREQCLSRQIPCDPDDSWTEFEGPTHPLTAFPVAQATDDAPQKHAQPDEGELPQLLDFMLHARKSAPYHSRSELLFSFLRAAINHGIDDRTIVRACLDPVFKDCAIYEHCKYNKGRPYVVRQISRVREKTAVTSSEARPLVRRTIDQFQRRELQWLWEPFIPSGMVTMFFGDGEVGKSTVALDIAARITRGRPLPRIGDDEQVYAPKGSVIVLSKEDDIPLIIRPRLEKAGADIRKVVTLGYDVPDDKEDFDPIERLDTTIADIKRHIEEVGDVKAIIIDPITDYVGKVDMYRDDQVRHLLNPLGRLAAKNDLAVIFTLHLNKSEDQAVKHRGMGSVAFRNVSKSTVLFAYDPNDPTQRLMAQDKKNLTPQKRTLAYTLPMTRDFPKVHWGRDWEQIDIEDVMNGKLTKQERARSWLRKLLKDGPVAVTDIQAQRATTGVSKDTLKLVKSTIGVKSVKRSDGRWCWQLP